MKVNFTESYRFPTTYPGKTHIVAALDPQHLAHRNGDSHHQRIMLPENTLYYFFFQHNATVIQEGSPPCPRKIFTLDS